MWIVISMERIRENGYAYYMEIVRVISRKFSVYSMFGVEGPYGSAFDSPKGRQPHVR